MWELKLYFYPSAGGFKRKRITEKKVSWCTAEDRGLTPAVGVASPLVSSSRPPMEVKKLSRLFLLVLDCTLYRNEPISRSNSKMGAVIIGLDRGLGNSWDLITLIVV